MGVTISSQSGWRMPQLTPEQDRAFLRFLILLEGYKVWDMIFLDWWLLTKSHFYQHYFPEVEGCESLKHTDFNRKEQLMKLCLIFPIASLALAGICTLIGNMI